MLYGLVFTIIAGLLLSSPAFIFLYIILRKINANIRMILSLFSLILVFMTFIIAGFNLIDSESDFYLPIIYSLLMISGIWIYIPQKNNVAQNNLK